MSDKASKWRRRSQEFATESDHWRMEFAKLQGDMIEVTAERNTLRARKKRVEDAFELCMTSTSQGITKMPQSDWKRLMEAIMGGPMPADEAEEEEEEEP